MKKIAACLVFFLSMSLISIAQEPRARDIAIPSNGTQGQYNAIPDVKGVEVGYSSILSGSRKNVGGKCAVRTGVTAIFTSGKNNNPVHANWYSLNGNGEMTGTSWKTGSGFFQGPLVIANSNSVVVVRDAVLKWSVKTGWYKHDFWYTYPVVAENYDGYFKKV